ncbi:hypothetical protein RNI52_27895 [Labrys neptuniae]|uniref:hypothetical protein n=1 Tax=Labrys neptuniae TaxID=376174 RepID=UPI00288DFD77|nr:hypothetical protein [Labrys neptuniae]MDT3381180.1 hypothetical protein [Labrys neptuniae]
MHINKVHHVTEDLGEDEDWLHDVANEMEIEDGVIWVYGVGEDEFTAVSKSVERLRAIRVDQAPRKALALARKVS